MREPEFLTNAFNENIKQILNNNFMTSKKPIQKKETMLVGVQCPKCLHIENISATRLMNLLEMTGYTRDECSDKITYTIK